MAWPKKFVKKVELPPNFKQLATIFLTLFIAQFLLGFTIIYVVSARQTNSSLRSIIGSAQAGIEYQGGRWDTAQYDSDPEIPGSYRLYVLSEDGFVIDRWRPISGLLDTSDFKHLSNYINKPSTLRTITNQEWRLLSLPITNQQGHTLAVASIGQVINEGQKIQEVDSALRRAGQSLVKGISADKGEVSLASTTRRIVPQGMSYQIVDQYNKILAKSDSSNSLDRIPNYIESSYLTPYLKKATAFRFSDKKTGEIFRVMTGPLKDQEGHTFGVIMAARSIEYVRGLFRAYIVAQILLGLPLSLVALWLAARRTQPGNEVQDANLAILKADQVETIYFDKDACLLRINDRGIQVTYASNQYYLCAALFHAPKKKWETDELQDRFGLDHTAGAWRKIYDAMNTINKKVQTVADIRLVTTSNKTYQINSDILDKIQKYKV